MYPGKHAATDPQRPAFIMAQTGAVVTYGELEARTNRLAHLLRARGPRPSRPLCHLHGEQPALSRGVRRRRARRPLLHLRQLVSDRRGAGLYRQQQRSENLDHVGGEARRGLGRARELPEDRALPRRRRPRRRRARAESRRGDGALSGDADRRRGARHADALFLGYDRAAERDLAAAADAAAGAAAAAVRLSGPSSGATATA